MIAYEETIRLPRFLSPNWALGHIAGTLVAAAVIYWSEFRGKGVGIYDWATLIPAAVIAFDFFPVLKILNGAFFPEVCIQITETELIAKRGFIQQKLLLDTIVEVKPVSASRVKKTTVLQSLYQNSDFLFLDRKHSSNVELLLAGGISKHLATARPEELTRILNFQVDRFRKESVSRLITANR